MIARRSFPHIRIVESDIPFVKYGIETGFFLFLIIRQRAERDAGEQQDRDDVDDGFEAHRDIGETPGEVHARLRADKYHGGRRDAENRHHCLALADKADVGFRVEIVADDGSEREHADGERDDVDRKGPALCRRPYTTR